LRYVETRIAIDIEVPALSLKAGTTYH
jgi:hypothetical protein